MPQHDFMSEHMTQYLLKSDIFAKKSLSKAVACHLIKNNRT